MSWIQSQKGDAKKAGILSAVVKVPTLLGKLHGAANVAVDPKARYEVYTDTISLTNLMPCLHPFGTRFHFLC